jgi:hypothetical protein
MSAAPGWLPEAGPFCLAHPEMTANSNMLAATAAIAAVRLHRAALWPVPPSHFWPPTRDREAIGFISDHIGTRDLLSLSKMSCGLSANK